MSQKLYRIVSLKEMCGLRFISPPNPKTIDLVVRSIGGSKRYRRLSLGVVGSASQDNIYDLTPRDQLKLEEGITFGVYYDGQQTGSGRDPSARVYVVSPPNVQFCIASYRGGFADITVLVPFETLRQKSDFDLLRNRFGF